MYIFALLLFHKLFLFRCYIAKKVILLVPTPTTKAHLIALAVIYYLK